MSVFDATSVLNQFHANLASITTASSGILSRSPYRFPLDKEPESGPEGRYSVEMDRVIPYDRKWGTGENVVTASVVVRVAYNRPGGDAGEGDRFSVNRKANDDAMLIADVCENPSNYNSSASGISIVKFQGIDRVTDLPKSEIWATRFDVTFRTDLHTDPVQDLMVASIIAESTTALSAMNALSLAKGTGALIPADADDQILYFYDKANAQGSVPDGDEVLEATGGGVWRKHVGEQGPAGDDATVWTASAASHYLSTVAGVSTVPIRIQANRDLAALPGESAAALFGTEMARPAMDTTTFANPPTGKIAIGTTIGIGDVDRDDDGNAMYVDDGDVTQTPYSTGTWARVMPLVLQPGSPIKFRDTGHAITRMAMIWIPNSALVSTGTTTIGRASTVSIKGAPDNDDNSVTMTRRMALEVQNQEAYFGDGISVGENQSSDAVIKLMGGGEPPVSAANQMSLKYDTATQSVLLSFNATPYVPMARGPMLFFRNYDPDAQTYASGATTVKQWLPTDAVEVDGFTSFVPRRFTIPARVSIGSGNYLVSSIKYVMDSGSSGTIYSNNTDSDVTVDGDSFFMAISDHRCTAFQLIVTNGSGSLSASTDVGNFQVEAWLF